MSPEDFLAEQIQSLTKAQHRILVAALEAAGGSVRISPADLAKSANAPSRGIEVDATDGGIVVRLLPLHNVLDPETESIIEDAMRDHPGLTRERILDIIDES